MPGKVHTSRIRRLVEQENASTCGFRAALRTYLKRTPGWTDDQEEDIFPAIPRYVPDAYRLEAAPRDCQGKWTGRRGRIVVWEVEVTHPVSTDKLASYACFWETLDGSDLFTTLELHIINKLGLEYVVNLVVAYYAFCFLDGGGEPDMVEVAANLGTHACLPVNLASTRRVA